MPRFPRWSNRLEDLVPRLAKYRSNLVPRLVKFPRSAAPQKICFSSSRLDHYAHTIIGYDVDDLDDVYASSRMCEDDVGGRCYVDVM